MAYKIPFFPAPYPEELWYSTISRYHVRSGNINRQYTLNELFDGAGVSYKYGFNPLFANKAMFNVYDVLPANYIPCEELLMKHTLIPFLMRFYPQSEIDSAMQYYVEGTTGKAMTRRCTGISYESCLRYCPKCIQEDLKMYGEAYWHVPHQIPMMPLCPKHYVLLEDTQYKTTKTLGSKLVLPSSSLADTLCRPAEKEYDAVLTDMLYNLWAAPLKKRGESRFFWTKAIRTQMKNLGYISKTGKRVSYGKMYNDMCSFYGKEFVVQHLGGTADLTKKFYLFTEVGAFHDVEKYALLAIFLGLSAGALTGEHGIQDEIKEKLLSMSRCGYLMDKGFVAKTLNVEPHFLATVCKAYNIPTFWKGYYYSKKDEPFTNVYVSLPKEKKEAISAFVKANGFADMCSFVTYAIEQTMASFERPF